MQLFALFTLAHIIGKKLLIHGGQMNLKNIKVQLFISVRIIKEALILFFQKQSLM